MGVLRDGKTLDGVLPDELNRLPDPRDRAFAQELVYGVLRWYWNLIPQLRDLMHRPLRPRDQDIEMLLLIGLYQLRYLSTPVHAAVAATVAACEARNKAWAKGLVNATLRNAIRRCRDLEQAQAGSISARTAHPEWFIEAVQQDWPDHWEAILAANNQHPPFTLRVNVQKHSREQYLNLLSEAGFDAHITRFADHGITLDKPVPVEKLPDFNGGGVSVQDEAAQIAAGLLELPDTGQILDACAAPGGKTAHILEQCSGRLEVVAIDRSKHRVALVEDTLRRLALRARLHHCDATKIKDWWDGVEFDRILIDAPCSGSGVIRRHPDIKIHRRLDDVRRLVCQQEQLLNSLWPLLKAGGKLVYATCSLLKAENDGVVSKFVANTNRVRLDQIDAEWGTATNCGRQIITGDGRMDGFYYARLAKV